MDRTKQTAKLDRHTKRPSQSHQSRERPGKKKTSERETTRTVARKETFGIANCPDHREVKKGEVSGSLSLSLSLSRSLSVSAVSRKRTAKRTERKRKEKNKKRKRESPHGALPSNRLLATIWAVRSPPISLPKERG